MPDVHALLSASSSARWLQCTPSARLEAALPDRTSTYAEEGTRAHALAEKRLKHFLATGRVQRKCPKDVDAEMWEATGRYVDICVEKINAARKVSVDAEVGIEVRLDYSHWAPEGFGTGDCIIISDSSIEVIDLKYGKGVPVAADGNNQMRLYALGAYAKYGLFYDFGKVRMTIVQPRIDNISTYVMSVSDLLAWGDFIRPKAEKAYKGEGPRVSGSWCRFCKCAPTCRALADRELEGVREDVEATDLSPEEISLIVDKAKDIKRWLDSVEAYALAQALDGHKLPGLKLVEGRSARHITDEGAAAMVLLKEGYAAHDIYKPQQLQTITALEKLVGKSALPKILGAYIEKPKGKPTLVAESDKRPEMPVDAVTAADFDDALLEK